MAKSIQSFTPVLFYNNKDGQIRATHLLEDQGTINETLLKELESAHVNNIEEGAY